MARIAVVGGGIAGLSAAWALHQRGVDLTLFEASDQLGGKLRTERADGVLIDSGPDSFLSSKPAALQLIEQLGLSDRVINTLPDGGGTFILRDGRLLPLPEGITLLVPAEFKSIARPKLLSPLGKARMAMDYVIPRRADEADESIGDFVRRRVGKQAFERMAEPLLSGIYAGDADQLSLLSTFPRLRETERTHGSVIKGAIAQKRQMRAAGDKPGPHRTPFVSLAGGLSELIDTLADEIGREHIQTGAHVASIVELGDALAVELASGAREVFDGVVIAAPASETADMLSQLDARLTAELRRIPYVSSATISFAYNAADVADKQIGRGFVIPRAEGRTLTAVTWTSNKFGGRVPDGVALLRGFVGRAGNQRPAYLDDGELIPLVRAELQTTLGIDAEPILSRVYRWPRAMPQYNLGHQEILATLTEHLASHPGIALTGAAYRGVGIPDCISDATTQAGALADRISASVPAQLA
ncbi:MAG TPA: protoporphyrinogen oxidase [Thermomicrobiales bacterium]|nr:protoporphyrinogen oxidase [Thermomicrobiales bacterium]